ncbi:MAG: C4-type zinc ribbon domain-containing protein [Clostridiales bacterium]|jgi:predicted  nucleic acid-binding Zn-ribbon protein|nr:C4-type zinc ribbon domain-containing protein [Clostridiales bacterium]
MIKKILEFQAADIRLFKLENELKNSDQFKKIALYQKNIHESAESLKKYESESVDIISSYDRINDNITQAENSIAELVSAVKSMKDTEESELGEYEFYLKKLEKANEILTNNEKEVQKIKRRIEEIMSTSSKLLKTIIEYTEKKKQATADFDLLKNEKKADADKLLKEVAALRAALPQEVLDIYKTVKEEKKLPVFVKLVNKNQCFGCGMDLPSTALTKLKNQGDYTECPNCRRILYVE